MQSFNSFSELMQYLGPGGFNGVIPQEKSSAVAHFYSFWANYLGSQMYIFTLISNIFIGLAKMLYFILTALEESFYAIFNIFNVFSYLNDKTTVFGKVYVGLFGLGVGIFIFIIVFKSVLGIFGKPIKVTKTIKHLFIVVLTFFILPAGLTTISQTAQQTATSIRNIKDDSDSNTVNSLAITPFVNNIVDVKTLIDNDFDTSVVSVDKQGYLRPTTSNFKQNNITSSNFNLIDFSATYGVVTGNVLNDLDSQKDGIKGLFEHKLNADATGVDSIQEHNWVGVLNMFEPVYPRFIINWVPLYAQLIVLIVLVLLMSLKVANSAFEILLTAVFSPLMGFSNVNSRKYKELILTMVTGICGALFEMIIMVILLETLKILPNLKLFDNIDYMPRAIVSCIVYYGLFKGAMKGVTLLERYFGISTSHEDTASNMLGSLLLMSALKDGVSGTKDTVLGLAQTGSNTAKRIANTPNAIKRGINKGSEGINRAREKADGFFGQKKNPLDTEQLRPLAMNSEYGNVTRRNEKTDNSTTGSPINNKKLNGPKDDSTSENGTNPLAPKGLGGGQPNSGSGDTGNNGSENSGLKLEEPPKLDNQINDGNTNIGGEPHELGSQTNDSQIRETEEEPPTLDNQQNEESRGASGIELGNEANSNQNDYELYSEQSSSSLPSKSSEESKNYELASSRTGQHNNERSSDSTIIDGEFREVKNDFSTGKKDYRTKQSDNKKRKTIDFKNKEPIFKVKNNDRYKNANQKYRNALHKGQQGQMQFTSGQGPIKGYKLDDDEE